MNTSAIVRAARLLSMCIVPIVESSCVLSVDPIIPESEAQFDSTLIGSWEEVDGTDRAVVSRGDGDFYSVQYMADGSTGKFEARLGTLGGRTVLDVWPGDDPDVDIPEVYAYLLISGHLLLAADIDKNEVAIALLQADTVLAALQSGELRLTHSTSREENLVLSGSTEELRLALGPFLSRPGVLDEPTVFRRSSLEEGAGWREPVDVPCFTGAPWPDADSLFLHDPNWVGADGASSVDLGDGRVLWLFGDTSIDPSGRGSRKGAQMVSNTVGIQNGLDPSTASIAFYWGRTPDGAPAAFIPDSGPERHWFGNGVRVGDRLVLFLNRLISSPGGLGFESIGWVAWMIENPDEEPSEWSMYRLATPDNPLGVLVGFAAVRRLDDYVYAFGSEDPVKTHPVYAVRWLAERVESGDLSNPTWWAGERLGWVPDSSDAPRYPIFQNGQSDLSIHRDPHTGDFLSVQSQGFGPADVVMRAAPAITGPWSKPEWIYRPKEYGWPNVMIYSAKAHPELAGGDMLLTYATNTSESVDLFVENKRIYYPRFVRLSSCD